MKTAAAVVTVLAILGYIALMVWHLYLRDHLKGKRVRVGGLYRLKRTDEENPFNDGGSHIYATVQDISGKWVRYQSTLGDIKFESSARLSTFAAIYVEVK